MLAGGLSPNVKLEPHQVRGVWLVFADQRVTRRMAALHERVSRVFMWDMGTGKTLLAIASICAWRARSAGTTHRHRCVVVAQV